MNFFTKTTFRNFALSVLSAAVLSACGGAGSCTNCSTPTPTPTPGTLSLSIEAPSQYPAGLPVSIDASLTMTNTSSVDASNLVYTIPAPNEPGNYTKVVITPNAGVGSASGDCTNIAAGASCTFVATISAYASPGSFTVTATPNSTAAAKTTQSSKSLQADSISVTANLGLVDVPNTQNQYYILPNEQVVTANSTSSTSVMLSVWIKQASDGLSNIRLVDDKGESLVATLINKNPTYTQNSILTYSLELPHGKSVQNIQALSNTCTTINNRNDNVDTACSNNAIINTTPSGHGILNIQPSYTVMSESYNTQVITLTNTGTGNIGDITYPNFTSLGQGQFAIIQNNCSSLSRLTPEQSCTLTVKYTADTINSGAVTPIFSYDDDNNGATEPKNTAMTIVYEAQTPPSPGPDPIPVTPFSVLDVQPSSISLTGANPEQTITLLNTPGGETTGAQITNLSLPTLNAPLGLVATTCGNTLAVGSSCSYIVKYASAAYAGESTIQFTYNNGQASQSANVAIDWSDAEIYAYIVNSGVGVQKCPMTESGDFYNCYTQTNSEVWKSQMSDAVIETVNGTKYMYLAVSNYGVAKCTLDESGEVSSCENPNDYATSANYHAIGCAYNPNSCDFSGEIYYIAFGTVNNVRYAYLSDEYENDIYTCTLTNNGDLNICTMQEVDTAGSISFINQNGTPYLYMNGSVDGSEEGTIRFSLDTANGEPNLNNYFMSYTNDGEPSAGTGADTLNGLHISNIKNTSYAYTGYAIYNDPQTYGSLLYLSSFAFNDSGVFNANTKLSDYEMLQNSYPYTINSSMTKNGNYYLYMAVPTSAQPPYNPQDMNLLAGLYKCLINPETGSFSGCNTVNNTAINKIYSVAFTLIIN